MSGIVIAFEEPSDPEDDFTTYNGVNNDGFQDEEKSDSASNGDDENDRKTEALQPETEIYIDPDTQSEESVAVQIPPKASASNRRDTPMPANHVDQRRPTPAPPMPANHVDQRRPTPAPQTFGEETSSEEEEDEDDNDNKEKGNQPTFGQDPVPYPRPSVQFHPLTENRVIPINFSPADTYAEEGPQRRVTDKKKYKHKWHEFKTLPPPEELRRDADWARSGKNCLRYFCMILIFIVIFLGTLITKATVLFAASNIRDVTLVCTNSSDMDCVRADSKAAVDLCELVQDEFSCLSSAEECFSTVTCTPVKVRWVWCVFLILITPQIFTFIQCTWKACLKNKRNFKKRTLFVVLGIETLSTTGLTLFAFRVLPNLDSAVHGAALMLGMGVFPAILKVVNFGTQKNVRMEVSKRVGDILALVAQLSAIFIWPLLQWSRNGDHDVGNELSWTIPVSLILISLGWWENYVHESSRLGPFKSLLKRTTRDISSSRTKLYIICSLWKIILIFFLMMAWMAIDLTMEELFEFSSNTDASVCVGAHNFEPFELNWVFVWLICSCVGFLTYFCARTAGKVLLQLSYAVPLTIVSPVAILLLMGACGLWNNDYCSLESIIPKHLFWQCYESGHVDEALVDQALWMALLWWMSQVWLGAYIFVAPPHRLMKTDRLFIRPMFDNVMFEQWFFYNWSRGHGKRSDKLLQDANDDLFSGVRRPTVALWENWRKKVPMIYFCATMWHETRTEMMQMVKSVLRCDVDQCARRNVQNYFERKDPDYYEFEAHIFFDDAMQPHKRETEYTVNSFVKQLVGVINEAAKDVHKTKMLIPPPTKYPTPYGGRLEWVMPGGNKIVAHLKDKVKVRHKKRWSQVMFMYYFLGHHLWLTNKSYVSRKANADNIYLMALDGDTDFQPQSVLLLVDLLKHNPMVGAACGRIHPIGSGPMVWYQKFEYALGHWLQKSTEHVLGCVLCSPGCFSMYRGSALMDDNVMEKYTTTSSEALHYVQYDQGEDRWLCTLLLQAGWRIEYSAASDAYTYAPNGFSEFFNQRRRWIPSTMANIIDLLSSGSRTVQKNDNISYLYMAYQGSMFGASLLVVGAIFFMIVESIVIVYDGAISAWVSLVLNLIPVVIFVIVCFISKQSTQLWLASVLTMMYSLLMVLVIVGAILSIGKEGLCSPTGIFFFAILGFFLVAALIHPQESHYAIFSGLYFLGIPAAYLLLIIYAICNIHDNTWGTREVYKSKEEVEEEEFKKLKGSKKYGFIKKLKDLKEEGFTFGIDNVCRCICCPRPATIRENDVKMKFLLDGFQDMKRTMEKIMYKVSKFGHRGGSADSLLSQPTVKFEEHVDIIGSMEDTSDDEDSLLEERDLHDGNVDPYWIKDSHLGDGPEGRLPQSEVTFFQELIERYLQPLKPDSKKEQEVKSALKKLRNNTALGYFMINAIFVTLMFTLQRNSEDLSTDWPCGDNIEFEPIGFVFVIFFGSIMFIQFCGMLAHRIATVMHIVAFGNEDAVHQEKLQEDLTNFVRRLTQAPDREDSVSNMTYTTLSEAEESQGREIRSQSLPARPPNGGLERQFRERIKSVADAIKDSDDIESVHRKSRISKDSSSENAMLYLQEQYRKSLTAPEQRPPRWSVVNQ